MTTVGTGDLKYKPVEQWLYAPSGDLITEAVGVAVDSENKVYAFNRSGGVQPAVIVFDSDGNLLDQWGQDDFTRPHGIWITESDTLILTDDLGHRVRRFTTSGELLGEVGPSDGVPADTGVEGFDYRKIRPGCGPFNMPTNAVTTSAGDIFVADGYGNARLHKFSPEGTYEQSWGEPGDGPMQFNLPHGLAIDASDRLYLGDRENSRIQILSTDGELLDTWTNVIRPCEIFIGHDELVYVAELGALKGVFPWQDFGDDAIGGRISILDQQGNLLCRWGGEVIAHSKTDFYAPHDIWVDRDGDIYLSEVTLSAANATRSNPLDFWTLRKFARVR
ncbi:MAG: hypothetical protein CMJ78_05145 [Planctomycetaceae bacterium]|nr:hypothetical protein [Planctomycetaceae bacterium]